MTNTVSFWGVHTTHTVQFARTSCFAGISQSLRLEGASWQIRAHGMWSVRLPQYCQGQSATTWSWTQRSWTFRLRRACLGHFLGPQLGRQCQTSMIASTEPMDCYQQQDLHMSCHVLHDYVNVENEISKWQTRRRPGKHIDCMRCDRKHRAKSDLVTQLRTVCNVDRTLIRVVVPNASQICTTSSAIFWTDLKLHPWEMIFMNLSAQNYWVEKECCAQK